MEVFDGDGNRCRGVVERVDPKSHLIFIKPLWATWEDGVQSTLPSLEDALFRSTIRALDDRQETTASEPEYLVVK